MKVKIAVVFGILLLLSLSVLGYTSYHNNQAMDAVEHGDVERLEKTLNRPLVAVDREWMNVAVEQFDVRSALVLYEHGGTLSDEQWVYLADLMTFEEFERIVEAGAALEVAVPSQTLLEGLYSLNDEPEKWRFAHDRVEPSFLNAHPSILLRAVYDGNTEAFVDLLNRMDADVIPFKEIESVVSEMQQQIMSEALMVKKSEVN